MEVGSWKLGVGSRESEVNHHLSPIIYHLDMKKLAFISNVLLLVGIFSVFTTSCKKDKTIPEPVPVSEMFKIGGLVVTQQPILPDNMLQAAITVEKTADSTTLVSKEVIGTSKIEPNKRFEMQLNTPMHLYNFEEILNNTEMVSFVPEDMHVNISNPNAKTALLSMLEFHRGEICNRLSLNDSISPDNIDDLLVCADAISILNEQKAKIIMYMYVNQDVKIEGEGVMEVDAPIIFDLDLKKGWNIILLTIPMPKDEDKDNITTTVESIAQVPATCSWFMLGDILTLEKQKLCEKFIQ